MICSIDPAFKKCGIVLIDTAFEIKHYENYPFLSDTYQKQNQTDYILTLWDAINTKIKSIQEQFQPTIWLIEAQIGQFACAQVQSMLIIAISQVSKGQIISISPVMKLKETFGCDFVPDKDTKQYNQNKNKSVAIAKHLLSKLKQDIKIDRDIADAFLMAVYYKREKLHQKLPID